MTPPLTHPGFKQYRAPRQHESVLIDPAIDRAPDLITQSQLRPERSAFAAARADSIDAAIEWTGQYRSTHWCADRSRESVVIAGHQPTLFHPGVWLKNFALSKVAIETDSLPVNLIVDNDVSGAPAIGVPRKRDGNWAMQTVAICDGHGGLPFEQTMTGSQEALRDFPKRVAEAIKPLNTNPCVQTLWPHVMQATARTRTLGHAIAMGRHAFEESLGLRTLEVPLSRVVESRWFGEFVFDLIANLPKLCDAYNDSADVYRAAHGIRSAAHPVPNLQREDDWFEIPLWIYSDESPRRAPAWAKVTGTTIQVGDRNGRLVRFDTTDRQSFGDQWAEANDGMLKIRPRALITTMYSRFVLSDLFLHGIGGGKYDQLGDMIAARVLGAQPPAMMVLSGTVHLPDQQPEHFQWRMRAIKDMIRLTHFRAEAILVDAGMLSTSLADFKSLIQEKKELIRSVPPKGKRGEWHQTITAINRKAAAALRPYRDRLSADLASLASQIQSQNVLLSRELSFCLYDVDRLTQSFEKMLTR